MRREDFRVSRFKQRSETTTVFVVDASGSSALHRLAEAKGAVELLLADCYVRRDSVALIAFRGRRAELLLPPTRSLVRAKRSLAGLPGGGGTPLAAGIDAALALADAMRRRGATPVVVPLTDGRANIARDGAGRARAGADALPRRGACGPRALPRCCSTRRRSRRRRRANSPRRWARLSAACRMRIGGDVAGGAGGRRRGLNMALVWERDGRAWPHREASRFVQAGGLRWHVQRWAAARSRC